MHRRTRNLTISAVVLAVLAVAAWQYRLAGFAWYWTAMQLDAASRESRGVWLPAYRVAVEARPIGGVEDDASGLTFSERTGTLFAVINSPPQIVELDTEGQVLRRIALRGAKDVEGITYVRDDVFVVTDEREHQLYRIRVGPDTEAVDLSDAPRLGLALKARWNRGLEGVSWDSANHRLYVTQEKAPLRVLAVSGLKEILDGTAFDLQIVEWRPSSFAGLFVRDLSALSFHEATGHLLLLSDESALIVEYDADGRPVSMLPMWRGWHGLSARVPQAEGLAVGPDGAIYVLSEPNLFYRFERETKAAWAQ
tara:strand:+ start:881 stop:1807 length:927 start_codon:yes stop_codon:yes gene_type:complete